MDATQGADRSLQYLGGEFLFFFQQDSGEHTAVGLGRGNLQDVWSLRTGIEQAFGECFGCQTEVQAFMQKDELSLAGWIEFLFGAVARRNMLFCGLNLAS